MSIDLEKLTLTDLKSHLGRGDFSVAELVARYKKSIDENNAQLNAYLEVFGDVETQARAADLRLAKGEGAALTGLPLAVKDNILIEGRAVSAASRILAGYRAVYDATAVGDLKKACVVFLGRTNMDEFAMGGSTEHSAFGVTKNPHDFARVAGGSSGGSAAAVAGGMALSALGSDTGGSVRQPAAYCGVVGLKPTYGAVSRSGLIAMGSSLDQIGPLTKTVADAELIFRVLRHPDSNDSTTLPGTFEAGKPPKTVGVPYHFFETGVEKDVRENFDAAIARLESAGFAVRDITLPTVPHALAAYYIIMPAEASTNLARFDGVRYGVHEDGEDMRGDYAETRGAGFGKEVRRRIVLGTYVLSAGYYDAYYTKANIVRARITEEFRNAFQDVDLIATPTTPSPAFEIGEKTGDPLQMYLEDLFTVPANIAGIPALSIPSGTVARKEAALPVGLQLLAPCLREDALFAAGRAFEETR